MEREKGRLRETQRDQKKKKGQEGGGKVCVGEAPSHIPACPHRVPRALWLWPDLLPIPQLVVDIPP